MDIFPGPSDSGLSNFLTVNGSITLSPTYTSVPANMTNGAGNGLLLRSGNYIFSGGGSYFRAEVRSGELRDGANNGIATNAYLDLAGNANNNPLGFGNLDLAGFNQSLVGIQNLINNTTPATVTNSSTLLGIDIDIDAGRSDEQSKPGEPRVRCRSRWNRHERHADRQQRQLPAESRDQRGRRRYSDDEHTQ